MAESTVALVTGCSSGIGRATAGRLVRAGWTTYATARPHAAARSGRARLPGPSPGRHRRGPTRAAVETVVAEHGAVGVLINNAGYSQSGALETLSMTAVRQQIETNVFGLPGCASWCCRECARGGGEDRQPVLHGGR